MTQQWPVSPTTTQQPDPHLPMTQQWPARPATTSNQTHTTQQPDLHHPSITHTHHQQCVPAIGNAYLSSAIHTCHWQSTPPTALYCATWKLLWVCTLMFRYAAGLFHKFFFHVPQQPKVTLFLQWELQALFYNGGPTGCIHCRLFFSSTAQYYVA